MSLESGKDTVGAPHTERAAADKLVLNHDLEQDLISLSHDIHNPVFDAFSISPTVNRSRLGDHDLNEAFSAGALPLHLAVTGLVRIDGEIAGFATEQEVIAVDPETGDPYAESAWLMTLNRPGLKGFLAVKQREDGGDIFSIASRVLQQPAGPWEDRDHWALSTVGTVRVALATDDLEPYEGGVFEEYNFINPADYARLGRFRTRIRFVIHPAERSEP